jgi:preprotein translocase subunit SecA
VVLISCWAATPSTWQRLTSARLAANEDVLEARRQYAANQKKYKAEIAEEAEKVRQVGGLFILGTERHDARRIDNQLRGRSGRQGDPGESRFYLSLEDDILRLFGSERIQKMMDTLKIDEDTPIDAKMLSNAIEKAQMKVESRNFQTRKDVLDYDDVMNTQREVIYTDRRKVLAGENMKDSVLEMINTSISNAILSKAGEQPHMTVADFQEAIEKYRSMFLAEDELKYTEEEMAQKTPQELVEAVQERAMDIYAQKEAIVNEKMPGDGGMREAERVILLGVVDEYWMEHLDAMDDLKQSIRLRAYGQEDPVVAFKRVGFEVFELMMNEIREETVRRLYLFRLRERSMQRRAVARVTSETSSGYTNAATDPRTRGIQTQGAAPQQAQPASSEHGKVDKVAANESEKPKRMPIVKGDKVGPNDPCPCGSGKKFKKCHGKNGAKRYVADEAAEVLSDNSENKE